MVDELRTEEEQIEALKKWWQQNGKSLVISVVLAVAVVFGYKAWQNHQVVQGEAASDTYFQLLNALAAVETATGEKMADANLATAEHLAGVLKTDFESSTYAVYAALLVASQSVTRNDLTEAEAELQWVVDHVDPADAIYPIAKLRLARVVAASGDEASLQRALSVMEGLQAGAYQTSVEETRGDIYLALGNEEQAREAYRQSLAAAEAAGMSRPLVTVKLADLAVQGEG